MERLLDAQYANAGKRASVGASAQCRFVNVDGVALAYDDEGEGPIVIGTHATAHGSRDFIHLRARLQGKCRLITLDWPGHGRSAEDHRPFTAERCAELMAGLIDALNIPRAILVGCSIGGAASLLYAHRHPERVAVVVACNPGGLSQMGWVDRRFCDFVAFVARAGQRGNSLIFSFGVRALYSGMLNAPDAVEQKALILDAIGECARPLEQAWLSFKDEASDLRSRVATLTVPVVYAWAKSDMIVSFGKSRAAIEQTPQHRVDMFKGGHCAFLEDPDRFADMFTALLLEHGEQGV